MGVHDYIDFIQRNGQCLYSLDPDERIKDEGIEDEGETSDEDPPNTVGTDKAMVVRVPDRHTIADILSWKLTKFAEFPVVELEYTWDGWDFIDEEGEDMEYSEYLMGNIDDYYRNGVWKCDRVYPGQWLLNFEENSYKAFVLGEIDPERIPWYYYQMAFDNRDWNNLPPTKADAFARLANKNEPTLDDCLEEILNEL
jgi:hypothetical protein